MYTHNRKSSSSFKDVYAEVTSYVIQALEQGTVIWQKPWHDVGLPQNITTKTAYRGWNAFLLNFVCLYKHYSLPYFITYRQAQMLGGTVKRGEHGYQIIYWAEVRSKYQTEVVTDSQTGEDKEVSRLIRVPKVHTVFNIDQTQGIDFGAQLPQPRTDIEKIAACEQVVTDMPKRPAIFHMGNAAYYVPVTDEVYMPQQGHFTTDAHYYATLFHELAHSTGHRTRLHRQDLMESKGFGSASYSKEELTAELTAAYLCGVTGIQRQTIDNSAAYLNGWLKKLKSDKHFFLQAATQASAAADFILAQTPLKTTSPQAEAIEAAV